MRNIQRAIALFGFCLFLAASSALGQSEPQTVVNLPFNFVVGDKTLPAGEYVIRRNQRDSDTTWVVEQKGNGANAVLLTRPTYAKDTQEANKLVFNRYSDVYFLSEIWTTGSKTGREVQMSNRERSMDKAIGARLELILNDRGR